MQGKWCPGGFAPIELPASGAIPICNWCKSSLTPVKYIREMIVMRQYAWLDYHGGCWHLNTGDSRDHERKWAKRNAALSDLLAEGWVIDETRGDQSAIHDAGCHGHRFGLRRTIH